MPSADERETAMEVDDPPNPDDTAAKSNADPSAVRFNQGIPEYEEIVVPPAPESVATVEANGPRLLITHITNQNFKSYAGTQTLGPFHKSFSSIVGPNGSGKSNVIDSMLFVFGYRANKIRSKKISVLIHNSENHKNIDSCTVSVHFQKIIDTGPEDNDYDVVPNSQFVVSRTAFRDNSSYYKYNDKKVTYKEVAKLLRGSGIDLDHNRFLILQGEVEQIAMMKPKGQTEHDEGMLEFLEDIIGSSRFKEPIETLCKRVEELNEIRGEKLNRVKAVEKEKEALESVKNEAVEYLRVENNIVHKKNQLYQKYIHECSVNEEKAAKKRDEINDGMKELTDKLSELADAKKSKAKEHKKLSKHCEDLTKKCEEKKEQFSAYEQQDVRCREHLKHSKLKVKKLEKSLEQEQKVLGELKMLPEKTSQDIEGLNVKLEKLEKQKEGEEEKLKEVMDSLKTETQGLQVEKEEKETELIELQKTVNEKKSQMNVARSEHDIYISNQQTEEAKLREAVRNLDKATGTLRDRRSAVTDFEKRLPQLQQALEKAKKDHENAASAEASISEQIRASRVKVEEARSSLSAASSRGKVQDSLMDQKRSGKISGIYGRLGDLGAIDEKYDVAISTACGALDNMVVENINVGQKCVEFLKRNNIGSSTFICLDKMAKWRQHCNRKITTPENVPRLFDLVKVKEPDVLPAFYFALRDTLVAKDLEQATRIAYGKTRYRVVTLGGQLIDTSGTMSGGGNRVCKGRMGSAVLADVDPKQLQMMEQKLAKDTNDAQRCRDNKLKLEETLDKMEKSVREMSNNLLKFNMDIQSLTEQEVTLKEQVKDQEAKVKAAAPDPKQLKEMEKKVETYKKDYEKAQEASSKVEKEVYQLHKQIMDIGGTKLKSAQSKVDMISNQIDIVTGSITKANVALKTAGRNIKKAEGKVSNLEKDIAETQESIVKYEQEFKQLEEDATKVVEAYQQAEEDMKEAETALAEIVKEVAKLEEEEGGLQKDNLEVKHELERYEAIIRENTSKIKHWKKELGKLSLHVIEGVEVTSLDTITAETLAELNKEEAMYEITMLEEKLAQMKPNMAAIAEYKKKEELYLKRVGELDQITSMRDAQRQLHEDLRKQRLDEFMNGFTVITNKLKQMYQMITLGGDAELELVDSLDPFSEGIVFSVRPPKKSWKNISNLSGGEKTLSSLALVFALHHYKPTPLYVMDEIDAALDFKNVSIVANYIKERTKNAQFIIISLRNNMFELADRLIGIYKTDNCTKSCTVNPKKLVLPLTEINA